MFLLLAGAFLAAGVVLMRLIPVRTGSLSGYARGQNVVKPTVSPDVSASDLMNELNTTADDGGEGDLRQLDRDAAGL